MKTDDDEDDSEPYESGPFCRHYRTPGECDKVCAACGHACGRHNCGEYDEECFEHDCSCKRFEDDETT